MLRALLFDLDGTLAETEELHRQAFNAAFAAAGLPWHWSPERYAELLAIAGGRERIHHYQTVYSDEARRITLDPEALLTLHRDKNRRYHQLLAEGHLSLRPGVLRLAREAKAAGARLAIVTTTSPENVDALLTHLWPVAELPFDLLITAREAPRKKPDPQAYEIALTALHLSPQEAIAIEDTAHGAAAANALGIPVLITESRYGRAPHYPGAFAVVEHLGEPDHPARFLSVPGALTAGHITWSLLTDWLQTHPPSSSPSLSSPLE
ncbi:MAG: HAD-IA family hydrolase [Hydrogenophilus sp.]|nr:HAD-IA family hydrolase [Hydrogenophilus sp.]